MKSKKTYKNAEDVVEATYLGFLDQIRVTGPPGKNIFKMSLII